MDKQTLILLMIIMAAIATLFYLGQKERQGVSLFNINL